MKHLFTILFLACSTALISAQEPDAPQPVGDLPELPELPTTPEPIEEPTPATAPPTAPDGFRVISSGEAFYLAPKTEAETAQSGAAESTPQQWTENQQWTQPNNTWTSNHNWSQTKSYAAPSKNPIRSYKNPPPVIVKTPTLPATTPLKKKHKLAKLFNKQKSNYRVRGRIGDSTNSRLYPKSVTPLLINTKGQQSLNKPGELIIISVKR